MSKHLGFVGNGCICISIGVALIVSSAAQGDTISIPAEQDTFIRGYPTTTEKISPHDDLGVWVIGASTGSHRRRGIVEFDLSGVGIHNTITDAHLEFYQMPDPGNNTPDYFHDALILNATSTAPRIDETTFTYVTEQTTYDADLVDCTLGDLTLSDANDTAGDNMYRVGASATAADLTILNSRRANANPNLQFALFYFESTDGYRIFGDREGNDYNANMVVDPPQPIMLVVTTEAIPTTLTVDRRTGALTLVNETNSTLGIRGYSITSASGSLDQSGWIPISGNYDVNGSGSVDANDPWTVLSDPLSDTDLSEYQFGGDGGEIGGGGEVVLSEGGAWIPSYDNTDLSMELVDTEGDPILVAIEYVGLFLGDMDGNGKVEQADVAPFIQALTDRTAYDLAYPDVDADLTGDFDGNGQLDVGDINGFSAAIAALSASASASAVPEPATFLLLLLTSSCLVITNRPVQRRSTRN